MYSRGGSLLPSIYADARYIDAVIVSKAVAGSQHHPVVGDDGSSGGAGAAGGDGRGVPSMFRPDHEDLVEPRAAAGGGGRSCKDGDASRDSLAGAPSHTDGQQLPGWDKLVLYKWGVPNTRALSRLPTTARLLASWKEVGPVTMVQGLAELSRLAPQTSLREHTGPTNTRIRIHLPLVVPPTQSSSEQQPRPAMGIAVGGIVREWRVGKCIAFDDSFVHSAWHDGLDNGDRIVLLVDVWHPDLDTLQARYDSIHIPDRQARFIRLARGGRGGSGNVNQENGDFHLHSLPPQ